MPRHQDQHRQPNGMTNGSSSIIRYLVVLSCLAISSQMILFHDASSYLFGERGRVDEQKETPSTLPTKHVAPSHTSNGNGNGSGNGNDRSDFYADEPNVGILSQKEPLAFFGAYRDEIDSMNDDARCQRYGFQLKRADPLHQRAKPRRIFFGSLVASEPWELFEIIAAETYGMYEGIVLVESNRTQAFYVRNLTHYPDKKRHEPQISAVFGIPHNHTQIRLFVDENPKLNGLTRERAQRNGVLQGWKELGMQPDDVGILSDLDEVLTRDFLRAIQVCDVIDKLDYHTHRCNPNKMGLRSTTQVYESSPECIMHNRLWHQPSVFPGHCLEGIGDARKHPPPPRGDGGLRLKGWDPRKWNDTQPYAPSADGADFRRPGAGTARVKVRPRTTKGKDGKNHDASHHKHYSVHSGFHFHNWFLNTESIRFKYKTYGHPDKRAYDKAMVNLSSAQSIMVHCALDEDDPLPKETHQKYIRIQGGFEGLDPFTPIYFKDAEYRRRRQNLIREIVLKDNAVYQKGVAEPSPKKSKPETP